jgi:hypothetical protein
MQKFVLTAVRDRMQAQILRLGRTVAPSANQNLVKQIAIRAIANATHRAIAILMAVGDTASPAAMFPMGDLFGIGLWLVVSSEKSRR